MNVVKKLSEVYRVLIRRVPELIILALFCVPLLTLLLLTFRTDKHSTKDSVFVFKNLAGPATTNTLPPPELASYARYDQGGKSRLAILLTDEKSDWLGLAHGLESIGIPFRITTDYKEAIRHQVVMVYPTISGRLMKSAAYEAVVNIPRYGGTLMTFNVEGGSLKDIFAFGEVNIATTRTQVSLNAASSLVNRLDDPREMTVPIADPQAEEGTETIAYTDARQTIARYDDGGSAVIGNESGRGKAYTFGFDLGTLILKGYNNRQQNLARSYANQFEPALDVFLRLIKEIYERSEPRAATLSTVPFGKQFTMIWTHDIDFTRSIVNAVDYARLEAEHDIHGTYFIQTKYIRDWNDDVFLNDAARTYLKQINDLGGEIGSHSVSHSQTFSKFPLGTGGESYPAYQPRVVSQKNTVGGTILGELRVSRFLLESLVPEQHVDSFRPGHLQNPYSLPEALVATDYRYSSSVTANDSLTHLPFRLTYGRGWDTQTPVYEFPVTIEDEEAPDLLTRLPQAIDLCRKISRYGGLVVVLIHPDILGTKLKFEEELIKSMSDQAHMVSLREFGKFWVGRTGAQIDVATRKRAGLRLNIQMPEPVKGLTVNIPDHYTVQSVTPSEVQYRQTGNRIILDNPAANKISFVLTKPRPVRRNKG